MFGVVDSNPNRRPQRASHVHLTILHPFPSLPVMKTINCLSLSFPILVIPLLLLFYTIASFPSPPHSVSVVHHSLASLPETCTSWKVYPEDFYEGGAYVTLPQGRVSYIYLSHRMEVGQKYHRRVIGSLVQRRARKCVSSFYILSALAHFE